MPILTITGDKRVLDAIREVIQNTETIHEVLNDNHGVDYDETHDLVDNVEIEEVA